MKIPVVAILGVVGMVAQGQPEPHANVSIVPVYVRVDLADPALRPLLAECIASRIFADVGVRIRWRTGRPHPDVFEPSIVVDIVASTPRTFHPGALAYAHVYEGVHIRIFWDRVADAAASNRGLTHKLLAHVMVHEITHVLEGINRHSREGLMKANWTDNDILQMAREPLPFAAEDVTLIHSGIAARAGAIPRVLVARAAQ